MKGLLLFLFLATMVVMAHAQGPSQADLLARIGKSQPDTNRVDLLLKAGCYHLLKPGNRKEDLDSAFSFFNPALELSRKLHAEKWINESLKWKGDCYLEGEHLAPGEACFREVIDDYRRKGDKQKEAETWMRLADCIPSSNPIFEKEFCRFYRIARGMFGELRDTAAQLTIMNNLAQYYYNTYQLDSAEMNWLKVADIYRAIHYKDIYHTYDQLRMVYHLKMNYRQEIYYTLEMTRSAEATNDTAMKIVMYEQIADSYYYLRMYDESLLFYRKLWNLREWPTRFVSYRNRCDFIALHIVRILLRKNRAEEALRLLEETNKNYHPTKILERCYKTLAYGNTYEALNDQNSARAWFGKLTLLVDTMIRQPGPGFGLDFCNSIYVLISTFYVNRQEYHTADSYFKKMAVVPKSHLYPEATMNAELVRSRIDSGLGHYSAAFWHLSVYKKMSDSLVDINRRRDIEELQVKYETEQKDKDIQLKATRIELLDQQNALAKNAAERSRLSRNMMMGGIGLLLLLVGVVWNRYRLKRRSNLLLEQQKREIMTTNTRLEKLLHENEWLMREVHHRVKNNLQVVMSLLNSQTAYMKDPVAISAVMEGRHRVQAMSLIHQKLYRSTEVSSVDLQEYIGELVDYLRDSFDSERTVGFHLDVAALSLDVSQAVPLGLIVNEVITNSYKYAFSGAGQPRITLRLSLGKHRAVKLFLADNGRGLAPDIHFGSNEYFGLSLIRGLCEDLEADLHIDTTAGTAYTLSFTSMWPVETARLASAEASPVL